MGRVGRCALLFWKLISIFGQMEILSYEKLPYLSVAIPFNRCFV